MGKGLEQKLIDYIVENKEHHYRLAYSYVRDADNALDIVQESIYKALSSTNSLKNPAGIKSWFYRIVVNTALDFLRKQKRVALVDGQILENYIPGADDHYQDIDLHRAVEDLPPSYRSVIVLRYFEDLKLEEVADVLDENVNTIKTRLYTALKKLGMNMNEPGGAYER